MAMTARAILTAAALATCGMFAPAQADWVPPFEANDTGGIIAYSLYTQTGGANIKAMAIDHCARYGKAVKLTGVQANYGGYISFACVWVRPGHHAHRHRHHSHRHHTAY